MNDGCLATNADKVLLLLNGTPPSPFTLKLFWKLFNRRIAADGAANYLRANNLFPDAVAGDLDSMDETTRGAFSEIPRVHLPDQNLTDAEKCIRLLFSDGVGEIHALGFGGGRADHQIHNLRLLHRYNDEEKKLVFWSESEKIGVYQGKMEFLKRKNRRLSFFCLEGTAEIHSTSGLEYNLDNVRLSFSGLGSISNRISEDRARIDLRAGRLCCFEEYTPGELASLI